MKNILILSILFLSGCESSNKEPLTLTNEQAVYESVALKFINSMSKKIIVLNKTNGSWFQNQRLSQIKEIATKEFRGEIKSFDVPPILLERIHASNQKAHNINWNPIIVNGKLEPAENHAPFKKGPLQEKYSYYSFSRVAFTNDNKSALVKFTHHCFTLCGGEWLVYLKFEENQWKFIQSLTLSIS